MHIYFDEYPRYSSRTFAIYEKNANEIIQCDHGYAYSSGKKNCTWVNKESWPMIKTCFPDAKQINQCPNSPLWKECTYVQEEKDKSEGNIDSPPDNKTTFSSSYFLELPIVNVETIGKRFEEMNLNRVQQKGDKGFPQKYEKYRTVQHKKRKATLPRITSPDIMDIREAE